MPCRFDRSTLQSSAFITAVVLFLAGCTDQIVSECEIPESAVPMRAMFSDIEQQLFAHSCATAGCHAGSRPQAGLSLVGPSSHDALVGVESRTNPGRQLVAPGHADESVLVLALRRSVTPSMPPAGPVPQAIIDSVAAWVAAGAPRN